VDQLIDELGLATANIAITEVDLELKLYYVHTDLLTFNSRALS